MKYCKNCKREYPESKNFCEDCGGKLSKFVEHSETPKKSGVEDKPKEKVHKKEAKQDISKNKKILIGILSFIAILLIISLVGNSSNNVTVGGGSSNQPSTSMNSQSNPSQQTSQPSQTCRDVQEAYIESEPYTVQVPYEEQVPYQKTLTFTEKTIKEELFSLELGAYRKVTSNITNTDSDGGNFILKCFFSSIKGTTEKVAQDYIPTGSLSILSCIYDSSV